MKKVSIVIVFLFVLFCVNIYFGYCEAPPAIPVMPLVKAVDVNKDGKPDVIYYSDGKYVSKIKADTNYDGRPDIIVKLKDGKFQSAEVDTDYNGKPDKKFTDVKEFNKWVNENKPNFEDKLNRANWEFALLKF
ncbi:MAG: hypothetical protein ABSB18_07065 [Candidatus Omnitrophota bacterium]